MVFPTYITGPFFMVLGFIFCLIMVAGIKCVILFIKEKIKLKFPTNNQKIIPLEEKKKQKPQKSVYLNTDDIDRIYFKKSS